MAHSLQHATILLTIAQFLLWNGWYNQNGSPVPRSLIVNEVDQPLYREVKTVMAIGRACMSGAKVVRIVMQRWASALIIARPPWPVNAPWHQMHASQIFASSTAIVHIPGVVRLVPEWDAAWGLEILVQVIVPPIEAVQRQLVCAKKVKSLQTWGVLGCLVPRDLLWARSTDYSFVAARGDVRRIDYSVLLRRCTASTPPSLWPLVEFMAIVQLARVCRKCWRSLHTAASIIGQVAKENARARIYRDKRAKFEVALQRHARTLRGIVGMTERMLLSFVQASTERMNFHRARLERDIMHGQPSSASTQGQIGESSELTDVCPSVQAEHARVTAAYDRSASWLNQTAAAVHAEVAELLLIRRTYGRVQPTDVEDCVRRLRDPMHDYGILAAVAGATNQGFWNDYLG